jgi:hypothetical protein
MRSYSWRTSLLSLASLRLLSAASSPTASSVSSFVLIASILERKAANRFFATSLTSAEGQMPLARRSSTLASLRISSSSSSEAAPCSNRANRSSRSFRRSRSLESVAERRLR